MARRKRTELNVTDPRALRTLAHPARQRLITELYSGEVLTATQAAELVGLTPSATSYHLRALEKAGVVTRGDATGDGRQRPWKAAADSFSIRPEAHRAAGAEVSQASLAGWITDLEAGLARGGRALSAGDDNVGHMSRSRLWLSESEVRDVSERVREIVDEYRDRSRADHPADATPRDTYLLMLPAEEMPDAPRED